MPRDGSWQQVGIRSWGTNEVKRRFAAATWMLSTWIVAVTQALADLIVDGFSVDPNRIVVLPNGVNDREIYPLDAPWLAPAHLGEAAVAERSGDREGARRLREAAARLLADAENP